MSENTQLVLISGGSSSGKSASLEGIRNHESIMHLNTESNKRLPFRNKIKSYNITDPYQVYEAFAKAEDKDEVKIIAIDSLTFLMDQFETQYVVNSPNTMQGWGDFAQYFKLLMQKHVAESTKSIIFTAHTLSELNKEDMVMETKVPVKGSLKNNGLEAYFSTVVSTKRMTIKDLEKYKSPLLTITDEENILGFKYVFQTKLTKETVNERIRSNKGMWETNETFIDNNAQLVLNRLEEYYG